MLGTSAFDSVPYIENNRTIAPVSEIRQSVDNLEAAEIAARHRKTAALFRGKRNSHLPGTLHLPARHFFGILHVGKIDYPHGASGVISEIHIMRINISAMHAPGDRSCVFRKNFGMHRVASVEKNDSVFPAGRTFAGDDADLSIGRNTDVVDNPRVNLKRFGGLRMRGIRY